MSVLIPYVIEKSGGYHGLYHVLHGAISPLDGVGPADLRVRELLERLRTSEVAEVILNQLFAHTQLQVSFGVNNLALVGGMPKTLGLP